MANRLCGVSLRLGLAMACLALSLVTGALAQAGPAKVPDAPSPTHAAKPFPLPDRLLDKPSQPPAFAIPVEPIGFSAPGHFYLGLRESMVSLDFLDENRLLFTFHVPGLMRRGPTERGDSGERQLRAVVIALPAGTVEAEALWTVHDKARYLWMLKDGHFLLRDNDSIELGDATLELKPYLRFPGPLVWLEMDPVQQYLVADSHEPGNVTPKPGVVPSPPTAAADIAVEGEKPAGQLEMTVRILRRDSGQVMLVSRTRSAVHLPINADGYLESLRSKGHEWMVVLNNFAGGSTVLGRVESTCSPLFDFLSQREVLVTACAGSGAYKLVGLALDGRRLWEAQTSNTAVWPLVVRAPDGSRLAREALAVSHAVTARSPLDPDDVKGQIVEILDAADGKVVLETAASPALDAGGNVAISPSGRRVAVLNAGAIQVFELPAPPPLPDPAGAPPPR